jgi:uncharacterized protein (TIGR02453 family)
MPTYFKSSFIDFFKELSKNNNTTWFNENKKKYEQDVKNPFITFIEDVIKEASKLDKNIKIEAKDAITRINRDIRFSKDKSPYKMHVSAIVSAKGKKEKEYPGVYIELAADKIMIYGGAYMLEKEPLQKVRNYIVKNLAAFQKVISDKTFVKLFGEIHGDKNKVIASEFKALLEKQPLLANKNFYYFAEIPVKELTSSTLLATIMKYYKTGHVVNEFLLKAIG